MKLLTIFIVALIAGSAIAIHKQEFVSLSAPKAAGGHGLGHGADEKENKPKGKFGKCKKGDIPCMAEYLAKQDKKLGDKSRKAKENPNGLTATEEAGCQDQEFMCAIGAIQQKCIAALTQEIQETVKKAKANNEELDQQIDGDQMVAECLAEHLAVFPPCKEKDEKCWKAMDKFEKAMKKEHQGPQPGHDGPPHPEQSQQANGGRKELAKKEEKKEEGNTQPDKQPKGNKCCWANGVHEAELMMKHQGGEKSQADFVKEARKQTKERENLCEASGITEKNGCLALKEGDHSKCHWVCHKKEEDKGCKRGDIPCMAQHFQKQEKFKFDGKTIDEAMGCGKQDWACCKGKIEKACFSKVTKKAMKNKKKQGKKQSKELVTKGKGKGGDKKGQKKSESPDHKKNGGEPQLDEKTAQALEICAAQTLAKHQPCQNDDHACWESFKAFIQQSEGAGEQKKEGKKGTKKRSSKGLVKANDPWATFWDWAI